MTNTTNGVLELEPKMEIRPLTTSELQIFQKRLPPKHKYPFSKLEEHGLPLVITNLNSFQEMRIRQAAYAFAHTKGWKFTTSGRLNADGITYILTIQRVTCY